MQKFLNSKVFVICVILSIIMNDIAVKLFIKMDNKEKLYLMLEWWFESGIPSYINREIVKVVSDFTEEDL